MSIKKTFLLTLLAIGGGIMTIAVAVAYPHFFSDRKRQANVVRFPRVGATIAVEVARTPYAWARGLMFRESMAKDVGMLFVFPSEGRRQFWMKNTLIPLDIVFVAANGMVVDIKKDFAPCNAMLCPSYTSAKPALYVLEINAGSADRYGIAVGDAMEL